MADVTTSTQPSQGSGLKQKTLGLPLWAWLPIVAVGTVGFIVWRRHAAANSAAASTAATDQSTQQVTDASGIATDQAETIYSQLRDIQGQLSSMPPAPAGPAGATGPTGPPGPVGPAAPPPPPSHNVHVATNGSQSLNQIAASNHSTVAGIIAQTRLAEPTDTTKATSKLKQYLDKANFNTPVPAGFTLYVPVQG